MTERRAPRWLRALVSLLALGTLASGSGLGEISVDSPQNTYRSFLMMSEPGGDDPSPWPTWQVVRPLLDAGDSLNTGGDTNGDLYARFALHPATRYPVVTWAWWDGSDYEIVLSRWTGTGWSAWQQITNNALDDVDPAVSIDASGVCRVTWWRNDSMTPTPEEGVWFAEALDGSTTTWSAEELVTGVSRTGRRPDVAIRSGVSWIVFEEQLSNLQAPDRHRVFVAHAGGVGWQEFRLGPITLTQDAGDTRPDLEPRIHVKKGVMWVDWLEGAGTLAWRVYRPQTDTWAPANTLDFSADASLAGNDPIAVEMGRQRIERLLLGN